MKGLSVLAMALLATACAREDGEQASASRQPDSDSAALPEKATPDGPASDGVAQLAATQGSTVTGSLALTGAPDWVHITGAVQGLKPDAEFGFHIHERGDCSAPDASSAGGHFKPAGQQHGDPAGASHHAGAMMNIRSNSAGVAQVDTTARGATIHSGQDTDVMGKAVVVHENPDDYTSQPAGNAGKRLACGVIAAAAEGADGQR